MVNLNVICGGEPSALRVFELVSRLAVGLALDNIHVSVSVSVTPIDDEEGGSP
jgi:hypothetical protein